MSIEFFETTPYAVVHVETTSSKSLGVTSQITITKVPLKNGGYKFSISGPDWYLINPNDLREVLAKL